MKRIFPVVSISETLPLNAYNKERFPPHKIPFAFPFLFRLLLHKNDRKPHEILSNREFEIFKLLAMGKTITQIANSFSLALTTVSTHRGKIMEKLNLSTNAELTRYAIAHHIISDIDL